jgi:hypothetical protein
VEGFCGAPGREPPEDAAFNAQTFFHDEMLEIMRHQRVIAGRLIHLNALTALEAGAHRIAALARADKRNRHRFASGFRHHQSRSEHENVRWLAKPKLAATSPPSRDALRRGSLHSLRERRLVGGERIELPTNGV